MRFAQPLRNKDLLSIFQESWALSWPMALSMFLLFLMGLCDVYVAGKFGKEVQAAYGVVFQVYFIFGSIAMALTVGSVSVVSRLLNAGKKAEFDNAIGSSLLSALLFGVIMAITGFFAAAIIINALGIPQELTLKAIPLLKIYSVGLIFHYILLASNGVLRATAMIRKSLVTMCVVCVLNLWLNFVLSLTTPLGFCGIAVATVISTWVGSIINSMHLRKLSVAALRFSLPALRAIIRISWPVGLLQIFWQVGTATLFSILSNMPEHAIEIMAAFTNGLKIEAAIFLPAFAFNMANAVVVGNFIGTQEQEKAFHAGILTAVVGVIVVTVMTLIVMLQAMPIASFLSNNERVINECVRYIYISLLFEPVMAWGVILGGGLNGAGDTKSVMSIIAMSVWLVRIPLCYILGIYLHWGVEFVWWSMNFSIVIQAIFLTQRYFKRQWIIHADIRNV